MSENPKYNSEIELNEDKLQENIEPLLSTTLLDYSLARGQNVRVNLALHRQKHFDRLQRLDRLGEKQYSDLVELKNSIEYITRHSNTIQNALRDVDDSDAAVPICSNVVKDIIAVKTNIQKCINNSMEIKEMLGVNYEPLMENLLKKMEVQLTNWSNVLNVASRNLLNSKALVENIQNLIMTQQQICSEIRNNLFSNNVNSEINSTPQSGTSEANTTVIDLLNDQQIFCSTPIKMSPTKNKFETE